MKILSKDTAHILNQTNFAYDMKTKKEEVTQIAIFVAEPWELFIQRTVHSSSNKANLRLWNRVQANKINICVKKQLSVPIVLV